MNLRNFTHLYALLFSVLFSFVEFLKELLFSIWYKWTYWVKSLHCLKSNGLSSSCGSLWITVKCYFVLILITVPGFRNNSSSWLKYQYQSPLTQCETTNNKSSPVGANDDIMTTRTRKHIEPLPEIWTKAKATTKSLIYQTQ